MDIFDQAQLVEEAERDSVIAQARAGMPSGPDRALCDCGAEIGVARRRALPGVATCFECAEAQERLARLHRGRKRP